MTTEIIVSVLSVARPSTNFTPKVTDGIESAKKACDAAHERLYAKYSVDLSDIAKK